MNVRPREEDDEAALRGFLERHNAVFNARGGELVPALQHPALLAENGGRIVGALTYVIEGNACEVLTLHADRRRSGVGTALLAEVERLAGRAGCVRLWLITTNDNVDALRFYQRRGFRLVGVNANAVDESRARLKAEIPETGAYGIPLRDELELVKEI